MPAAEMGGAPAFRIVLLLCSITGATRPERAAARNRRNANDDRRPSSRFCREPCGDRVCVGVGDAQAQGAFPTRPITLVVPLPAGGTADLLCRFAADKASAALGQQMVVENRPGGAGGRVGTEQVLRSAPDGYTLLCAPQLTFSITHLVFTKAAFDTRTMEPISVLATYPLILIGRADAAGQQPRPSCSPMRAPIPARSTTATRARAIPAICSANC